MKFGRKRRVNAGLFVKNFMEISPFFGRFFTLRDVLISNANELITF